MGNGLSYASITNAHRVTDAFVARWKRRFVEGGVFAVGDSPRRDRLDRLTLAQPKRSEIQIIADHLSVHQTKAVNAWLAARPRVTLHYTPTYISWRNQIELWFSTIVRDMIARGIFTSTADLVRTLMHYIRQHNKSCQPNRWSYSNPRHCIRANSN